MRFYSSNVSRSHVSIAGEPHLRKSFVPKLISVETIRFATDEILYRAAPFIFSRSTFARLVPLPRARARARSAWREDGSAPRGGKRRRCFLFMRISAVCALSFPLRGEAVKRARARERARVERCGKRERPCFISRLQTSSSPPGAQGRGGREGACERGDARASRRDYRGFLKAFGASATAAMAAPLPMDIHRIFSPGQWSFGKPLIGFTARIVCE